MPDNAAAWELLQAGATQLRMSGMGGPVGFDYNALALVAEGAGRGNGHPPQRRETS